MAFPNARHGHHLGIGLRTPLLVSRHNRHLLDLMGILISAALQQGKRVGGHLAGEGSEAHLGQVHHCLLSPDGLQVSVCQFREQLAPGKGSSGTLTAFCFFNCAKLFLASGCSCLQFN